MKPAKERDIKKRPYKLRKEIYNVGVDYYLGRMEILKAKGLYRETMFGTEIIWEGTKYHFSKRDQKDSKKNVFIFAMVKRDAENYLKKHKLKRMKRLPAKVTNKNVQVRRRQEWPADMDDAFWTIAYNLHIISKNTFTRGLLLGKAICNAALAALGSDKPFYEIINGRLKKSRAIYRGDDQLKLVYAKIRHRCLLYMRQLAKLLGDGFIQYETDCIRYVKTKKNMEMVRKFMEQHRLEYKGGVTKREKGLKQ